MRLTHPYLLYRYAAIPAAIRVIDEIGAVFEDCFVGLDRLLGDHRQVRLMLDLLDLGLIDRDTLSDFLPLEARP